MKVAIVGSRVWPELQRVRDFVEKLAVKYPDAVVVSGGAAGVDLAAEEAAHEAKLGVVSYRVSGSHVQRHERRKGRYQWTVDAVDMTGAPLATGGRLLKWRNGLIVAEADRVVAFDAKTGGTADTIEKTLAAGKPLVRYFVDVADPDVYDERLFVARLVSELDAVEVVDHDGRRVAGARGFDERRNTSRVFGVEPGAYVSAVETSRAWQAEQEARRDAEVEDGQLSLDDRETAAREKRDAAMRQVDDAAADVWKSAADDAILATGAKLDTFTGDDVWTVGGLPATRENRALGPRFATAARRGLIEKTGDFRPSTRSNMQPMAVWRLTAAGRDALAPIDRV